MFEQLMESKRELDEIFELNCEKVKAIVEASLRELEINYAEAELKVLKESGTDEDLRYYYEVANEELGSKMSVGIENLNKNLKDYLDKSNQKIVSDICSEENRKTVKEMRSKVKLHPILSRKQIVIENFEELFKLMKKTESKLTIIKAKLKSNQPVDKKEINQVLKDFKSEKKSIKGIHGATTITVAEATKKLEKLIDSLPKSVKQNEKTCETLRKDAEVLMKKSNKPELVQALMKAYTELIKIIQSETINQYFSIMKSIKSQFKQFKDPKPKDNKKVKPVKESADDETSIDNDEDLDDIEESSCDNGSDNDDDNSSLLSDQNDDYDSKYESTYDIKEDLNIEFDTIMESIDELLEDDDEVVAESEEQIESKSEFDNLMDEIDTLF